MDRPNIIFILSDDQGAWAMHCAGTKELYTPNLDRIANDGMLFDNFFCVSPVCSPARASLLTGKIPSTHGIHDWIRSGNLEWEKFHEIGKENPYTNGYCDERHPIGYLDGQITYTDLLAKNGYTCALSGKWHLGDSIRSQHGFSKWYSMGVGGCCYYHPDMVENGEVVMEHGKYVTEVITDRALQWLDELSEQEEPFYLSVHYTAPHSPWEEEHHPKKWIDYYRDCPFESIPDIPDYPGMTTGPVYGTKKRRENLIGYFAAISAMDEQIGRILDMLEEKKLVENTIVVFTADNGMSMGHHGIWGKGNGTFPMNMFDTAVKVPFIIKWPGKIPACICNQEMISAYDWFPTILDLANISREEIKDLPGRSFVRQLIKEPLEDPETQSVNQETQQEVQAVIVCDEYGPVRMIRTKEWKYIHRYPYGPHELYHLAEDPGEEHNLYGEAYEDKILEMRCRMERWFDQYVCPEMNGIMQGVLGGGQNCAVGRNMDRINMYSDWK